MHCLIQQLFPEYGAQKCVQGILQTIPYMERTQGLHFVLLITLFTTARAANYITGWCTVNGILLFGYIRQFENGLSTVF